MASGRIDLLMIVVPILKLGTPSPITYSTQKLNQLWPSTTDRLFSIVPVAMTAPLSAVLVCRGLVGAKG